MRRYKGDIMLLGASATGGTGFVFLKYLLEMDYNAFQIIAVRFLIATVLLYVVYFKQVRQITAEEWKNGTVLGVLLYLVFALLIVGLQYTTPSVNAFLSSLPAVIVPFILWCFFHKKPDRSCFMAAGMTFLGIVVLSDTSSLQGGLGMLLSFSSSVAFAFQMTFMDKFLRKGNALRLALVEHMTVLVLASVVVFAQQRQFPAVTLPALKYFLLLGVICTAVYFVLQSVGQQYTKPSSAAIILTTESVFASITAAVLYGERLSLREYVGCGIIFFAVILAESPKPSKIEAKKVS